MFITYGGKRIFYTDYRGLETDEEIEAFIDEIVRFQLRVNRPSLQLTNIEGAYFTPQIMKRVEKAMGEVNHLIIKDAIVGVRGIKRVLFQFYNTVIGGKARAFKTEEEAKEWLVKPS